MRELTASTGGVSVAVTGARATSQADLVLDEAVADGLPSSLVAKDATLWGKVAEAEAQVRLGWLDAVRVGRGLVPSITALRAELAAEGIDRIVLAGMGGSSLAPEVICATAGASLVVLDTTDPGQVRAALTALDRTVVVCSSKSGGTVETDSHRRAARAAFEAAGIDPARRVVVVTDPSSPLEDTARSEGCRAVFLADPNVGGRYSALTAFGLVPAGLAGVDLEGLLDAAAAVEPGLGSLTNNAGLLLGAALGGAGRAGQDKVVLADTGSGISGFGDWAEQLIAESTGKQGTGLLPVVVEAPGAPGTAPEPDTHLVLLGPAPARPEGTAVDGPLGGQFLVWEYATAVAGRVLGINPFDQPNVQESKDNTKAILDGSPPPAAVPVLTDGSVEVYGELELLAGADSLRDALAALLAAVPDRGYLAVMAYLDRQAQGQAHELRARLAARTRHPVTFGWAPRFLHSTGQYHKGGPPVGTFLQITGAVGEDLAVPGRSFTFGQLQAAQALGDLRALQQRARPVIRLHLTERATGLHALLEAANA
ncbi:MAG: glucose-6-phosphate isomerase [Actinomycetota bacterium]|nr:glucose-6-phosphate isomerase [Actinomycetota bacterium]